MNNYILIAVDTPNENEIILPAWNVARKRLEIGMWPLFARTPNKSSLTFDDRLFIYVAGERANAQSFAGYALVQNVEKNARRNPGDLLASNLVSDVVHLHKQRLASSPVSIRPLLGSLGLTKGIKKWGIRLQGGCIKIEQEDGELIEKAFAVAQHD